MLAAVFLVIAPAWWRVFSLLVGALGRLLANPRVRTALDRVTTVVLVGIGLRVALARP